MKGSAEWATLNRPASSQDRARAFRLAHRVAAEFEREGATAVLLAGSWARGDAHRWSDLDVWVLGRRKTHRLLYRDGLIVSIKETTARAEVRELNDPSLLGQAVLAWRDSVVLYDPRGVARRVKARARAFRWRVVAARCDRFVARSLSDWGEEVLKLTRHVATGQWESAAVQRNLLANDLAALMAIHKHLLYDENELWEAAGTRMGRTWHRTQRAALSVDRGSLKRSCEASVRLYCLSARAVRRTLKRSEREIIARVCKLVGFTL